MTGKTNNLSGGDAADLLTPAMRQYIEQKAAAPDALLLFRMGDFYELFYEDAVTASRVLGLTLTSRGKDKGGTAIPLAGLPYHALQSYLSKLVHAGYKVAISEQVEDPRQAKGVVKREIVRIVTPGTLTEDALLEQRADNYLACVCRLKDEYGLAFVELSTGAFRVQTLAERLLVDELVRLQPAELLVPERRIDAQDPLVAALRKLTGAGQALPELTITNRPGHLFDPYQAQETLRKHFGVVTLEGFGFTGMDASLCAAAVIVDYLAETQKTSLNHIVKLSRRCSSDYVLIDEATWRSLEVERTLRSGAASGSLVWAVDRTSTAMGGRCLRRWLAAPLRTAGAIIARQEAIADLLADVHQLEAIRTELGQLADIERITSRLGVGRASPRDLLALGRTLLAVEKVADLLDERGRKTSGSYETPLSCGPGVSPGETWRDESGTLDTGGTPVPNPGRPHTEVPHPEATTRQAPFLAERSVALRGQRDLAEYLTTALHPDAPLIVSEGGVIANGHDAELDRLRSIGSDGRQWLADYQAREIERSGIPSLKVGYNQVFGYYIEVTNTHRERIPADYVRKQTLKNAERYITDELKKYETEVLTAHDQAIQREIALFEIIRQHAIEHIRALQTLATAVAEIDVAAGLAHLADERRYARPELTTEPLLEIRDGRHPVLDQTLAEKFVPNDCELGLTAGEGKDRQTLVVLTGPNMAGKSTYIRQVALLTLLAQAGSYVPAGSMRFGPVDRIFARVGASDEISRGQSTFMVEMTEAANILNNATEESLVIIDELGRGTSTFDGLSLAWAIAEQLVTRIHCRTLFATHYHELTQLEDNLVGAVNCNVAVREWEDQIIFLHRIVRGGTDRSYGSHVAKLAGIPPRVIERSRQLLAELESNFSAVRRAPIRTAVRTKPKPKDNQLMLFAVTDPADDVIEEIRKADPNNMTPLDALKLIERWRGLLR
ncbi:MAG TPA: DNA mismatch repair protein MutS [Phycisphaerae bacterium]|nr:DNA mismatch repair protein MutS [Phycisphaerae bacterium]HSA25478.1 DNA mismatch repair protein MutS [Phycisphaerae bacterium]